ncbi:Lipocalin-related protein and Bos/Can/Equ allergen [hydrothermal vent metagenome]|uniref:Lipocalin-related protein and Bos/Can/Equ allergen n=1 Tax=hydrothermal vent metagenome TaxID=652676 RepID=A0A3B0Y7W7_9ZZZZ
MIFEDFTTAHMTVLLSVFAIAFFMGAIVNKTNFCTMGAVSDLVNIKDAGRMRSWMLAMAVAIIGVVIFEAGGFGSVDSTLPPYRGSNFAWLEYILGGLMFGVGMTLGSGCGNKALIRIGGGNLKSIILFAVISVCAYFMVNPFPGSDATLYSLLFYPWTSPASVSLATQQDLGSILGQSLGTNTLTTRSIIGITLAVALLWFIFKSADFRSSFDNKLGGISVGAAVLAAWVATSSLVIISADGEEMSWTEYASAESWDMMEDDAEARPRDVAVQSFTFINPIGQTMRYIMKGFDNAYVTFGLAAVLGVILGSFVWSLLSRSFRIEWFLNLKDFLTHLVGGVLMGIGGVLALGCTIGQGITGVSTLSIGSMLALVSIISGSAITMKIQYYKLIHEEEATFFKALISSLVDFKLLPSSMRSLEYY